jgi:tetratricopeptide (TPR) repeat protein
MRKAPSLLAALLAFPAGADPGIPWTRDQNVAFARSGERREPVMILFTSADCGGRAAAGDIARASAGGGPVAFKEDFQDRCAQLEDEVLVKPDVVAAAARFVPVIADEGLLASARIDTQDRNLNRRYQVGTLPTVLFADPWGNEIIRVVGRVPKDKFLQVVKAIPADFIALENAGRRLRDDHENGEGLVAAAAFYDERGLPIVSERLYAAALDTPQLKSDLAARRRVATWRGLSLLRLNRAGEAAAIFEQALAEAPDGPGSDALLFGRLMAELQSGDSKEARAVLTTLEKTFPQSPYTAKARQHLEGAARK